jgi:acetyl/propionyl-CoA carboxylase alpha subunit
MKILVANRGEIACRILKSLREIDVPSVAVYTAIDRDAPHVDLADEATPLDAAAGVAAAGPDAVAGSGAAAGYLDGRALLAAARRTGASAIHPGYGFLSQSAAFAESCAAAGVTFLGPTPEAIRLLGDKRGSRRTAEQCAIPVIPGASACDTVEEVRQAATAIGYPLLIKAAGGGGGKGMRRVAAAGELEEAFAAARREAGAAFADERLLVEKYIAPARHVEVQILADGKEAVALGERECSLQRRYQKVIEEGPSPGISEATRAAVLTDAVRLARAAGYRSAGTVEFLVGPDGAHYFLEVNTRIQVEHPVTEMLTGLDIVAAQVAIARDGALPPDLLSRPVERRGHAIEARLNAEDPYRGFLPSSGPILMLDWPSRPGLRIDSGIRAGGVVHPDYDPLLAKLIAWGADREQARRRLVESLRGMTLLGVATNQGFLIQVLESAMFRDGATFTTTLEESAWPEPEIPAAALAAARRALAAGGTTATAADGAGGAGPEAGLERQSPWLVPDPTGRLRP